MSPDTPLDHLGWDDETDTGQYKVLINHEEQYSVWQLDREPPLGWNEVGKTGTKQECIDYIEEVWTDMRPLSLRRQMEEQARRDGTTEED